MWYAVWTRTGGEEQARLECEKIIKSENVYEACILPKYEKAWRVDGVWTRKEAVLFPGYLFFITETAQELRQELRKVPAFTTLLGTEKIPTALQPHEAAFLEKYTNDKYVLEMSVGNLIGGELVITDGPLKDYHGKVVRIDRRKREATLAMEFFGEPRLVKVGLEVVRKADAG